MGSPAPADPQVESVMEGLNRAIDVIVLKKNRKTKQPVVAVLSTSAKKILQHMAHCLTTLKRQLDVLQVRIQCWKETAWSELLETCRRKINTQPLSPAPLVPQLEAVFARDVWPRGSDLVPTLVGRFILLSMHDRYDGTTLHMVVFCVS